MRACPAGLPVKAHAPDCVQVSNTRLWPAPFDLEDAMKKLSDRVAYPGFAEEVIAEVKAGNTRPVRKSWLSNWTDPVKRNAMLGNWERMELEARFSEHRPEEVAKWLNQAASDITTFGVEVAVDKLVDRMYPKLISNSSPDGR